MRRRVAVLHAHERPSTRVQYAVKALHRHGDEVVVYCWVRRKEPKSGVMQRDCGEYVQRDVYLHAPAGTNALLFLVPRFYLRLRRLLEKEHWDVLVCTHLLLLPFAVWQAHGTGARVVYDACEFYSLDIASRFPFARSMFRAAIELVENGLLRGVDGILTVDSRGGRLEGRYRRHCCNVEMIANVPDLSVGADERLAGLLKQRYAEDFVITYVGGIYGSKGANQFIPLLSLLRDPIPNVRLLLLGEFQGGSEEDFLARASAAGVGDLIEFHGWVDAPRLLAFLAVARVGLSSYQSTEPRFKELGRFNSRKVFDYMRCGVPVLAPSFMDVGGFVSELECGFALDTDSVGEIAARIIRLRQEPELAAAMGERGRTAVSTRFNWETEREKVLGVFHGAWA